MAANKMSPMMVQYLETKKTYHDCILFYRIGDFYEMFYEDAQTASRELELVLTGKDCGVEERAPMCGVPFHAAENYITKLVAKGYKVAIAEQVEDPKLAKGLVRREVIRVVTPGTITSQTALDESRNNFLMSIYYDGSQFGISTVDISTGEFLTTTADSGKDVIDELSRFAPSEIVCNHSFMISGMDTEELKDRYSLIITELEDDAYDEAQATALLERHFHASVAGIGLTDHELCRLSAAAALKYIYDTQMGSVDHISGIRYYASNDYMIIDTATQRNLELTETMREKKKRGSLLWVLDKTKTAMGARLLRRFIEQPLINLEEINRRQDAVEAFCEHYIDREEISEYLSSIYDLERLLGKISYQSANPRDLIAFRNSLAMLPHIHQLLGGMEPSILREIYENMDELRDLHDMIDQAIEDDPPVSARDGGIIKEGYHQEVDQYKESRLNGKNWLAELEAEEREKTGIKGLKIKYNRIFGYCFEVSNAYKNQVPDYFIRKQTISTAERYTSDRLEELQNIILGAQEKLNTLEYELFCELRDKIAENIERVQKTSRQIALTDCLISLSKAATANNYVRPHMNADGIIHIRGGRHPVIEKIIPDGMFVANDTDLDDHAERIAIITGPNMAGKSTYMRQVALIVLMASIGSFVPADEADISICDRIFTRVGASDDLASGQSTFMVEMNEVANILRNASSHSLLVLDEIGRGTSTFDGLSIAWAVVEYISKGVKAKTLFATHYHELTELEGRLEGVNNYCIAVKDNEDDIVFLRKIIPGGADKSYGIAVASLAGIPKQVIERAKEIAEELSDADILARTRKLQRSIPAEDMMEDQAEESDFMSQIQPEHPVLKMLREMDLNRMTPFEALNTLFILKDKAADGN